MVHRSPALARVATAVARHHNLCSSTPAAILAKREGMGCFSVPVVVAVLVLEAVDVSGHASHSTHAL